MNPHSDHPDHWHIDRKIIDDPKMAWDEWGQFIDDNPDIGVAIFSSLKRDTKEEADLAILAVWYWMKASGSREPELGRVNNGHLDIRWYPVGKPSQLLANSDATGWAELTEDEADALKDTYGATIDALDWEGALDQNEINTLSGPVRKLIENLTKVMAAEREWLSSSPDAPVVKAFFQGQEETPRGDVYAVDGGAFEWDAGLDIFSAPPRERNGMMERDQYESDALRESERAEPEARGWDGPYWVEAKLYPPSAELRAWREAFQLENQTVDVSGNHNRPRF